MTTGENLFPPSPFPLVRYDQANFPEDLMFVETGDRQNFQGRYVIRHPWTGQASCGAAKEYLATTLPKRQNEEQQRLANLTGWPLKTPIEGQQTAPDEQPWWERLWPGKEG